MRKSLYILLLCVIPALIFINCASQFGGTDSKKNKKSSSTKVDSDGGDVSLSDGTNVNIPAGALAVGTDVSVTKTDAPSDFTLDGVTAASDAVAIGATDSSGKAVEYSAQPMTIALPMSGAGLALLDSVEASSDNLCSLLKTGSYGNFVWRKSSLTIDTAKNLVSFPSRYFGTFQLVYCGAKTLTAFKDPNSVSLPGDATYAVDITIPTSFPNLSQAKYCGFVLRSECGDNDEDCDGGNDAFIGSASLDATVGTAQTVSMTVGTQTVVDDRNYYIGVTLNATGVDCSMVAGNTFSENMEWKFNQLFGYEFTADDLKAGISGSIDDTAGPFKTKFNEINIQIGDPNGTTDNAFHAKHIDPKGCIELETNKNVFVANVSFDAGGKISGSTSQSLPSLPGDASSVEHEVDVIVGANCFDFHGDISQVDTTTGKPYRIEIPNITETDVYISPIKMSFGPTFQFLNPTDKACLKIFPDGDGEDVGNIALDAITGNNYYLYLPFLDVPSPGSSVYDMTVDIVTNNCYEDGSQRTASGTIPIPIDIPDKHLTADIEVN